MKPLDPRLLRYAKSSRAFLVIGVLLGLFQTAAMVGVAWAIARGVTGAIAGEPLAELAWALWLLVACVVVRGLAQWGMEWAGARAAATAKSELRGHVVSALARLGGRSGVSSAEATTLATHGLEALDSYFAKYLPQLLLTAIAMPLLVVVTFFADPVSAITEIITIPIIPLFMILIGLATQRVQRAQLDSLTRLANAFLEIVEGLSTLKIFGRARRQRDRIREVTDDYRRSTMKVLRVTFLSGFALELFASLSVALVAVQIGIRLIDNEMSLFVGLFALILAPEVFAPLRQVGAQFHAASEGVEVSQRVFELVERADAEAGAAPTGATTAPATSSAASTAAGTAHVSPSTAQTAAPSTGTTTPATTSIPTPQTRAELRIRDARVRYGDREILAGLDFTAKPGEITAIAGESGAGKSTLLDLIRGEHSADRALGATPIPDSEAATHVAWMGQSAGLIEGTVRENVALGQPALAPEAVQAALARAGATGISANLELGVGGDGLSGGQAQRVSLARTIARAEGRDCPIVLLDEPTSALDAEREQRVIEAMRELADEGRIVIVVSHRRPVLAAADRTVTLTAAEVRA
ncbi:thiol reductant ABC exporter subunit CydD [Gulosibacter sp. ACHW.36C]|uniref:Thiol reductant ABC exporter subunit CydD n=1 Tax=Gulosibacter sediminis TaxID=1729695 RepID=A0ABY4MVN3_9MICO|nr:thiol reductant ABC exporter subunit CydD [Gulosibacter sediminis]UQN14104.1 thiol reductant ABC exporter subunit CydD [Gulosibacter sediminis]